MPPSQLAVFEAAWLPLLGPLEKNVNLEAAQSFVIAQIYHLVRSEYDLALRYRGIACAICHQLGMHLSETRFQHQGLTSQLRRRVFWTQYVLDRYGLFYYYWEARLLLTAQVHRRLYRIARAAGRLGNLSRIS